MILTDESSMFHGFHGRLGDLVFRRCNGRTVIASAPRKSSKPVSEKQRAQKRRFSCASAYAKSVMADPEKAAACAARLKLGQTVYHLVMSEFLKSGPDM